MVNHPTTLAAILSAGRAAGSAPANCRALQASVRCCDADARGGLSRCAKRGVAIRCTHQPSRLSAPGRPSEPSSPPSRPESAPRQAVRIASEPALPTRWGRPRPKAAPRHAVGITSQRACHAKNWPLAKGPRHAIRSASQPQALPRRSWHRMPGAASSLGVALSRGDDTLPAARPPAAPALPRLVKSPASPRVRCRKPRRCFPARNSRAAPSPDTAGDSALRSRKAARLQFPW